MAKDTQSGLARLIEHEKCERKKLICLQGKTKTQTFTMDSMSVDLHVCLYFVCRCVLALDPKESVQKKSIPLRRISIDRVIVHLGIGPLRSGVHYYRNMDVLDHFFTAPAACRLFTSQL